MTYSTCRLSSGDRPMRCNKIRLEFAFLALLSAAFSCPAGDAPKPVRIASGISGHIHPAACISKKGTVVVIFGQSDFKDLRVTRSTDAGSTWTTPEPFEPSAKQSIYPGSLTALKDGRIVHAWNVWYPGE